MGDEPIPPTTFGGGLFLVLSNLAFVPAILKLLHIGETATAINFLGVFLASIAYHSARADFFSFTTLEMHQIIDYLFVWRSLTWALTYIGSDMRSSVGRHRHLVLYFFFTNITFIVIITGYQGIWLALVGAAAPIVTTVALAAMGNEPLFVRDGWALATLGLSALAGVFFSLPHSVYVWAHGLWHIVAGVVMYTFLLSIWPRRSKT